MAKGNSFGAERVLALMLFISVSMLLAVPIVGRMGSRMVPADSGSVEETVVGTTLQVLSYGGSIGIVLSLLIGLVIAFGIGPSWMASLKEGMIVQDTFADDGENKYFGRGAPDLPGVRYYVRVKHKDGKIGEFHTDRATYQTIMIGQVLNARLLGRRLVKIESIDEPRDL